jgi:eukaryotic-like serine/threonine-protein kinase
MKPPALDAVDLDRGSLGVEPDARYSQRAVLGRGGMGEVRLCRDAVVGRDVALKVMLAEGDDAHADSRTRFLQEALVQGQLEHPSIPPLYDLGVDEGQVFFTMQCLRGRTLRNILDAQRDGDEAMREAFPTMRLLSAFASVCLAVDYAHQRGVIHRDLKPSNLMLGFFGEVTVLDWGIAKVGVDADVSASTPSPASWELSDDKVAEIDSAGDAALKTKAGELLGTVGYMAPEQARGARLSPATDIYALGALLFEILTQQPLHERTNYLEMVSNTVMGEVSARPSERAPECDVAIELEDLCVAATRTDPRERLSTARELHDTLTRFLDGQRDEERRRELASQHAAAAETRMASALAGGGAEERRLALAEAGRALALHADDPVARRVLVRLLTEPPDEPPDEALRQLEVTAQERMRSQASGSAFGAMGVLVVLLTGMFAMGLRDWRIAPALVLSIVAAVGSLYLNTRSTKPSLALTLVEVLSRIAALGIMGRLFGPLVLMPGLFTIAALGYAMSDDPLRARIGGVGSAAGFLFITALDLSGAIPSSYTFDGRMAILPQAVDLAPTSSLTVLVVASLVLIVAPFMAASRLRRHALAEETASVVRAWQLRQLAPSSSANG